MTDDPHVNDELDPFEGWPDDGEPMPALPAGEMDYSGKYTVGPDGDVVRNDDCQDPESSTTARIAALFTRLEKMDARLDARARDIQEMRQMLERLETIYGVRS